MQTHQIDFYRIKISFYSPTIENRNCTLPSVHQGEVSRTFLRRTFRGMGGSEKKFYSQISKNHVVFLTANERGSLFHHCRRRRLKKKPLQWKILIKIKEIRSEYLVQKHDISEFSNKFQTTFQNTYVHIFYITAFIISCRFHTCQQFQLHYSESRDFDQNVRYEFRHR